MSDEIGPSWGAFTGIILVMAVLGILGSFSSYSSGVRDGYQSGSNDVEAIAVNSGVASWVVDNDKSVHLVWDCKHTEQADSL
jgi:hypothetical protein